MSHTTLDHLNLGVRDLAESIHWYGDLFQFQVVEKGVMDGEPWAIIRSGDSMLCLYQEPDRKAFPEDHPDFDKFHHVYHFSLRIHDAKAWAEMVRVKKIKTYSGSPVKYPFSISWYIFDPSGYEIEVVAWDNDQVKFRS